VGTRAGLEEMAKRKGPIIAPTGNGTPSSARSLVSILTELSRLPGLHSVIFNYSS